MKVFDVRQKTPVTAIKTHRDFIGDVWWHQDGVRRPLPPRAPLPGPRRARAPARRAPPRGPPPRAAPRGARVPSTEPPPPAPRPPQRKLLAVSGDGTLSVHDVRKGKKLAQSEEDGDELLSLVVVRKHLREGGTKITVGTQSGVLSIFSYG